MHISSGIRRSLLLDFHAISNTNNVYHKFDVCSVSFYENLKKCVKYAWVLKVCLIGLFAFLRKNSNRKIFYFEFYIYFVIFFREILSLREHSHEESCCRLWSRISIFHLIILNVTFREEPGSTTGCGPQLVCRLVITYKCVVCKPHFIENSYIFTCKRLPNSRSRNDLWFLSGVFTKWLVNTRMIWLKRKIRWI